MPGYLVDRGRVVRGNPCDIDAAKDLLLTRSRAASVPLLVDRMKDPGASTQSAAFGTSSENT